jgi:hypothetical protein
MRLPSVAGPCHLETGHADPEEIRAPRSILQQNVELLLTLLQVVCIVTIVLYECKSVLDSHSKKNHESEAARKQNCVSNTKRRTHRQRGVGNRVLWGVIGPKGEVVTGG